MGRVIVKKRPIIILAVIGVVLLGVSVGINIWGVGKVNYHKEERKQWREERAHWIELADSLRKENILIDERIQDKEEAYKKLEDDKTALLDSLSTLEYDDILRIYTERYFPDGNDSESGIRGVEAGTP